MNNIYKKKWQIEPHWKVATAGSCFAQHIARYMRANNFSLLDTEPAPPFLPTNKHTKYGYSTYSARYGNIYTTAQLLQLTREVDGSFAPQAWIWEKDGRFYDGLRPAVEPQGLSSTEEVELHRRFHVGRVGTLLRSLDLLIFTLGLTETWRHKRSGTVFPLAPGVVAGEYSDDEFEFVNLRYDQVVSDLEEFHERVTAIRGGAPFKMLLTVSPVPLTATASGAHVLSATTYSKSVLRACAGHMASRYDHIDYFPSYEIVTNPQSRGTFYENNLRSVRSDAVAVVMRTFFAEHPPHAENPAAKQPAPAATTGAGTPADADTLDLQCEEQLLEVFGK